MEAKDYIVGEGEVGTRDRVEFKGIRLGSIELFGEGQPETITAYWVIEDDEESNHYMLTVSEKEGQSPDIRQDYSEYSFLGFYGVALSHSLVWCPREWTGEEQEPKDIPELRQFFPNYAKWGC